MQIFAVKYFQTNLFRIESLTNRSNFTSTVIEKDRVLQDILNSLCED